jgi:hypothetical protein
VLFYYSSIRERRSQTLIKSEVQKIDSIIVVREWQNLIVLNSELGFDGLFDLSPSMQPFEDLFWDLDQEAKVQKRSDQNLELCLQDI